MPDPKSKIDAFLDNIDDAIKQQYPTAHFGILIEEFGHYRKYIHLTEQNRGRDGQGPAGSGIGTACRGFGFFQVAKQSFAIVIIMCTRFGQGDRPCCPGQQPCAGDILKEGHRTCNRRRA
jgi:hypothetical protein